MSTLFSSSEDDRNIVVEKMNVIANPLISAAVNPFDSKPLFWRSCAAPSLSISQSAFISSAVFEILAVCGNNRLLHPSPISISRCGD